MTVCVWCMFSGLLRDESVDSDDSRPELESCLDSPKAPMAKFETFCDSDTLEIPAIKMDQFLPDAVMLGSAEFGESSSDDFDFLRPDPHGGLSLSPTESFDSARTGLRSVHSSDTLTPGTPYPSPVSSPLGGPRRSLPLSPKSGETSPRRPSTPVKMPEKLSESFFSSSPLSSATVKFVKPKTSSSPVRSSPVRIPSPIICSTSPKKNMRSPSASPKLARRAPSPFSYSFSTPNIAAPQIKVKHCKYLGFMPPTQSVHTDVHMIVRLFVLSKFLGAQLLLQ